MPLAKAECRDTFADYLTWPQDEHWELIDGITHNMSPVPARRHQEVVVEICRQFANQLGDRCYRVYVAPFDVRLGGVDAADEEITMVEQPDVSVFCDPGRLDEWGARGAPDLVVEVLSFSTAPKDLTVMREVYARYRVREYWVVESLDRVLMIWRLESEGYGAPEILALEGKAVSRIADLHLDLDQLASILEDM